LTFRTQENRRQPDSHDG